MGCGVSRPKPKESSLSPDKPETKPALQSGRGSFSGPPKSEAKFDDLISSGLSEAPTRALDEVDFRPSPLGPRKSMMNIFSENVTIDDYLDGCSLVQDMKVTGNGLYVYNVAKKSLHVDREITGVQSVSCGRNILGYVDAKSSLKTWGSGEFGQLGHGLGESRLTPAKVGMLGPVFQLSCGEGYSAVVSSNGCLYTWGKADRGQTGHYDTEMRVNPQLVPLTEDIVVIDCGHEHMGALSDLGHLWMWGANTHGQLGIHGEHKDSSIPTLLSYFRDRNLSVVQFSCGHTHSGAVTDRGDLYMWGSNDFLQLARGEAEDSPDHGGPSLKLNDDTLDMAQIDEEPEIQMVSYFHDKDINVLCVACGNNRSAAVTEDGRLFAWGWNVNGCLGLSSSLGAYVEVPTEVKGISNVQGAVFGEDYLAAITDDEMVYIFTASTTKTIPKISSPLNPSSSTQHADPDGEALRQRDILFCPGLHSISSGPGHLVVYCHRDSVDPR